jgi:ComF family protein
MNTPTGSVPVWAFGFYQGILAQSIRAIKYRPSPRLLKLLSGHLHGLSSRLAEQTGIDVLIPVPMHAHRQAKRGFNQAEVLATAMARSSRLPASPALVRSRFTRPQADCSEDERKSNLSGAFVLASGLLPERFHGKVLGLVDDVSTTGMTLRECAQILSVLKPAQVIGVVAAFTPRYHPG